MAANTSRNSIELYKDLPLIKNQRLKLTSSDPFTPTYIKSIVTNSSDPAGLYASRIQGRQIFLENPARDSKAKKEREEKKARQLKSKERKKTGIIGKREAKEKGVWRFEKTQAKFELFLPLHQLWLGYMSELLGLAPPPSPSTPPSAQSMPSVAGMHAKLVKADFHGSILTVRQSKNPCLIGLSGIVVHETENAFKVVTRNDEIKLLPKQHSIFAFAVPLFSTLSPPTLPLFVSASTQQQDTIQPRSLEKKEMVQDKPHIEFELYGNQFRFRSADRAGRKFKHKETIEL